MFSLHFKYDGSSSSDIDIHYQETIDGETYQIHKRGNKIISKVNIKHITY